MKTIGKHVLGIRPFLNELVAILGSQHAGGGGEVTMFHNLGQVLFQSLVERQ
jgi:hypothetical protein